MLSPYIIGRAGVFIDEANLFHSQRTLGWRIDYEKLYWMLSELNLFNRNIFIYTSFLETSEKEKLFVNKLIKYGYFVYDKEVKEIKGRDGNIIRKGNLDIELALDAFQYSYMYDTLILFSGDSDFAYLIDLLKEVNKKIIVISTRGNISKELMSRTHSYVDLQKLRYLIERNPNHTHDNRPIGRSLRHYDNNLSKSNSNVK